MRKILFLGGPEDNKSHFVSDDSWTICALDPEIPYGVGTYRRMRLGSPSQRRVRSVFVYQTLTDDEGEKKLHQWLLERWIGEEES